MSQFNTDKEPSAEASLSIKAHLAIIGLYAALAVILTWPLVLEMKSSADGDGYIYLQSFWWFKKALLTLQNPFVTDYVFFPQGANLAFNSGVYSSFLMTLPVSLFWGIPEAVNCSHLLSFTLSGYFAFLLANELFQCRKTAFLAGLIYAFIPYHVNHFPAQLNLSELQWIPLYLLLLKKTLEQSGWRWPVFGGAAAVIIMLTDSIQVVVIILLSLLVVSWYLAGRRLDRNSLVRLGVMGVATVILGSVYLWQVLLFIRESHGALVVGLFDHGGANEMSGDLVGFVTPQTSAPVLGRLFPAVDFRWRNNLYLGYLPMLLACYGGWRLRCELWGKILITAVVVGIVLTLGATLHMNGQWQWSDGAYLKLPFAYLSGLPLFSEVRTPYRFHIITALAVAMLAAGGFSQICRQLRKPVVVTILMVCCCALLLVEYYPGQRKYEPLPPVPEIYREIAGQPGDFSVLQLPLSRWSALVRNGVGNPNLLQYYQLTHGKKIFGGLVTRTSNQRLRFQNEVLDTIVKINMMERFEIFEQMRLPTMQEVEEVRALARILRLSNADFAASNNLRYVVLHYHAALAASLSRVFLEEFLQKKISSDQKNGTAYIKL